jgi:hypothetical protein
MGISILREARMRKSRFSGTTSMVRTTSLHSTVTERALIQRINRALPKGQAVKIARGKKIEARGLFYLAEGGAILDGNVDITKLGRELDVDAR